MENVTMDESSADFERMHWEDDRMMTGMSWKETLAEIDSFYGTPRKSHDGSPELETVSISDKELGVAEARMPSRAPETAQQAELTLEVSQAAPPDTPPMRQPRLGPASNPILQNDHSAPRPQTGSHIKRENIDERADSVVPQTLAFNDGAARPSFHSYAAPRPQTGSHVKRKHIDERADSTDLQKLEVNEGAAKKRKIGAVDDEKPRHTARTATKKNIRNVLGNREMKELLNCPLGEPARAGPRKTRAQLEEEKKHIPNAGAAAKARHQKK